MKILVGIQARSASKRFPDKIYQNLLGKPILRWSYDAAQEASKRLPDLMVRVLGPHGDLKLETFCKENLISALFPKCDENDLVSRFQLAAEELKVDAIIRITSDCWQTNTDLILDCAKALNRQVDYISNTIIRTYPEGLDLQACSVKAHEWLAGRQENREHPYFDFDNNLKIRDKFEAAGFKYEMLLNMGLSVLLKGSSIDTKEDLERVIQFEQSKGAPFDV